MYETYWRLDIKPFENMPDPRFLYYSPKHEEALMRLLYAVREGKQGAVLTGEFGSGKTVLSRMLLKDLEEDPHFQTILIVNPKLTKKEFLKEALFQLGENVGSTNEGQLVRLLEARLRKSLAQQIKTVFIVDEAQVLPERKLEELRLLLNFPAQEQFLCALILIGQTDLKKRVQNVESLKQRLAFRYHLDPLNLEETQKYIEHRLEVAGNNRPVFTPAAYGLVFKGSRGIPRQINNICDYALLVGFSKKVKEIDLEIIEDCLKDLDLVKSGVSGEHITHGTHSRHFEGDEISLQGGEGKDISSIQRP